MKDERSERFSELVEEVKALPIVEVIGTVIPVYTKFHEEVDVKKADRSYGNLYALCPFHPDEKLGSFIITPSKNMWWCFTCGFGWSGIDFERRYFNLPDFKSGVYHLARRMDLISEADYERLSHQKIDSAMVSRIEKSMKKPKSEKPRKADLDVIGTVYNAMAHTFALTDADKAHLTDVRKLPKDRQKDFFTFPRRGGRRNPVIQIQNEIKDQYALKCFGKRFFELSETEQKRIDDSKQLHRVWDQFRYVPGFYFDQKSGKLDFVPYRGIGIVTRDDTGMPTGIQIRKSAENIEGPRYVWFSSAFAAVKENCDGGASSGCPGGVVFPYRKDAEKSALCITEGRFKAEKLAEHGLTTIYVSGVSTWNSIVPIVKRLKGDRKQIYIVFDSDMMGNVSVHGQLTRLCFGMKEQGLTPILLLWKKDLGKGFDDFVIEQGASFKKLVRAVPFFSFEAQYQKTLKTVLSEFQIQNVRQLKKEEIGKFNLEMQSAVEDAFHLPEKAI